MVRRILVGIFRRAICRADSDGFRHWNAICRLGPVPWCIIVALGLGRWVQGISLSRVSGGSLSWIRWYEASTEGRDLRNRAVRRSMGRANDAAVLAVEIVAVLGNGGLDLTGLVAHEDAGRSILVGVRVVLEDGPGGRLLFERDEAEPPRASRLLINHNDRVGDFAELAPKELEFLFGDCEYEKWRRLCIFVIR